MGPIPWVGGLGGKSLPVVFCSKCDENTLWDRMKIITGVEGFIGTNLAKVLEQGHCLWDG